MDYYQNYFMSLTNNSSLPTNLNGYNYYFMSLSFIHNADYNIIFCSLLFKKVNKILNLTRT